jgi:hypothetical protein
MEMCKLMSTLPNINTTLIKHVGVVDQKKPREMAKIPYKQVVGNIMYVMIITKPNIAIMMGIMNQFMQDPKLLHWKARDIKVFVGH